MTSDGFALWIRVTLNAQVWLAVGLIALYRLLEGMDGRTRFWGIASWLSGTLVWLPVLGLMGWGWPHMDATAARASLEGMALTWILFATITSIAGIAILAAGAWRADRLVALGLAGGALAYVPGPGWLEFVGTTALALAFTAITWNAWAVRRPTTK